MLKAFAIIGLPLLFAAGIGAGYLMFAGPAPQPPPVSKGPNAQAKQEPLGLYTDEEVEAMRKKLVTLSLPIQMHEAFVQVGIDPERIHKYKSVNIRFGGETHWRLSPIYGIAMYMETGRDFSTPPPVTPPPDNTFGRIVIGKFQAGEVSSFPDKDHTTEISAKFPRPALEFVTDLNGLARGTLGFENVHVYRWRGGILEGSVQFMSEAGPVKQDLEVAKRIKERSNAAEFDDPRTFSGVITIATRRGKKDKANVIECVLGFNVKTPHKPLKDQPPGTSAASIFGNTLSGTIYADKAGIDWLPGSGLDAFGVGLHQGNRSDTSAEGILFGDGGGSARSGQKHQLYQLKVSADAGK